MVYKRLIDAGAKDFSVDIFEATKNLGSGMPYSHLGAGLEHVTNVSSDELPDLLKPLAEWVKALPVATLDQFGIEREDFHEKKVLPRLLFGQYLSAQFHDAINKGNQLGVNTQVHYETAVIDIEGNNGAGKVRIKKDDGQSIEYDFAIICSGHNWVGKREGEVDGYFDSPYPPAKLSRQFNHDVIVRGSSLTAFDAIRTIARHNGHFEKIADRLVFQVDEETKDFRVIMHSRHGMLPAVRVHMDEPHAAGSPLIDDEKIAENIQENGGFLQLDFLFEHGFKLPLKESDPKFYEQIKDMNMEAFVESMMSHRESHDPFDLFRKEYDEAKKSIREEKPVYWKEMLSALSFAMNYPAKYLSAEDMLRLQKTLMPLISVVIAFAPQESCEELMALNDAGRLEIVADGDSSEVEILDGKIIYSYQDENGNQEKVECKTFIDCIGQKHLSIDAFPFQHLVEEGKVSPARLKFRSSESAKKLLVNDGKNIEGAGDDYYLRVPGLKISDNFQVVDHAGHASESIYLMAVPYMGGFNPDYSGLDFCEHASELIVGNILKPNN
ncbi:MAG: FAD/NAD(P)-binding protein [Leptolyngbya sp.]|nr:FAD/NAD(P)-binding protein [Candidatus Melainabacteria bacterium]